MADEVTLAVFAKDIADGSKEARLALAQQLKDAGFWTGKINSDFNINESAQTGHLDHDPRNPDASSCGCD